MYALINISFSPPYGGFTHSVAVGDSHNQYQKIRVCNVSHRAPPYHRFQAGSVGRVSMESAMVSFITEMNRKLHTKGTSVPLKAWRQMEENSHTSSGIFLTGYLVYRVFPSDPYLGQLHIVKLGCQRNLRCFCAACQFFRPQRPNRSSFTDPEPVLPRFVRSDDTNYAGRKEDALERGGRQSKNHTMGKLIGGNSCVYVNYKQQPLGIL
ncbi:hypothetical protein IW261DRAFT_352913 [Armillaria novae-zelandiae]|uniref:Uncharacterized protein n=1 Tax=Armillaria novae-zelandiae TaxID=153914 RepID=A0AA39PQ55_9AGAR|nr:hypothetical protein IW261DRAFT_352913 [Armillaria novae-zelandiae]